MEKCREERLRRFRKCLIPALLLFSADALLFPGLPVSAEEPKKDKIANQAKHLQVLATDKFLELLAIRPGMTILDIGTGTGQFAYYFAEHLAGTGKVYATDIDDGSIRYVEEEAKRRGLDNLFPVLVKPEGVDEFYGRHRYDLIAFFHVRIPDESAFLAKMRDYLAEDGRLIVMRYRLISPFSPEDFEGHFPELIRELSMEPAGSPFVKGLSETTRQLIREYSGAEPDGLLRKAIVEDFNRLLSDAVFSAHFLDGPGVRKEVDFTPAERMYVDFLLLTLRETGVLDGNPRKAGPRTTRYLKRLNKMLFLQRFRKFLDPANLFAPALNQKATESFEKAGFRLESADQAFLFFEDVGVFRPDKKAVRR